MIGAPAGLETRDTADLEVCATPRRTYVPVLPTSNCTAATSNCSTMLHPQLARPAERFLKIASQGQGASSNAQATSKPSTWEKRATPKTPSCDLHATLMRPSCDPHATLKPTTSLEKTAMLVHFRVFSPLASPSIAKGCTTHIGAPPYPLRSHTVLPP